MSKKKEENEDFQQSASELLKNISQYWGDDWKRKHKKWPLRETYVECLYKIFLDREKAQEIEKILFDEFFIFDVETYTFHIRQLIYVAFFYPSVFQDIQQTIKGEEKLSREQVLAWEKIIKAVKLKKLEESDPNKFTENDPVLSMFKNNNLGELCCKRCKSFNVTYTSAQTRSADEAETNFYTCHNPKCLHKWKE